MSDVGLNRPRENKHKKKEKHCGRVTQIKTPRGVLPPPTGAPDQEVSLGTESHGKQRF